MEAGRAAGSAADRSGAVIAGMRTRADVKERLKAPAPTQRKFGDGGKRGDDRALGVPPRARGKPKEVRWLANGGYATAGSPDPHASHLQIQIKGGAEHPLGNPYLQMNEVNGQWTMVSCEAWARAFTDGGLACSAWYLLAVTYVIAHNNVEDDGMYKLKGGPATKSFRLPAPHEEGWPKPEVAAILVDVYGDARATRIIGELKHRDSRRWRPGSASRKNAPKDEPTSMAVAKAMRKGEPVLMPPPTDCGMTFRDMFAAVQQRGNRYLGFVKYVKQLVFMVPYTVAVAAALFHRTPSYVLLANDDERKSRLRTLAVRQGNAWLLDPVCANAMQGYQDDFISPQLQVRVRADQEGKFVRGAPTETQVASWANEAYNACNRRGPSMCAQELLMRLFDVGRQLYVPCSLASTQLVAVNGRYEAAAYHVLEGVVEGARKIFATRACLSVLGALMDGSLEIVLHPLMGVGDALSAAAAAGALPKGAPPLSLWSAADEWLLNVGDAAAPAWLKRGHKLKWSVLRHLLKRGKRQIHVAGSTALAMESQDGAVWMDLMCGAPELGSSVKMVGDCLKAECGKASPRYAALPEEQRLRVQAVAVEQLDCIGRGSGHLSGSAVGMIAAHLGMESYGLPADVPLLPMLLKSMTIAPKFGGWNKTTELGLTRKRKRVKPRTQPLPPRPTLMAPSPVASAMAIVPALPGPPAPAPSL